jgi:hypothetical protein
MTLAKTAYTEKGPFIITVSFAPNEVLSDSDRQIAKYVIEDTLNNVRGFIATALSNPQGTAGTIVQKPTKVETTAIAHQEDVSVQDDSTKASERSNVPSPTLPNDLAIGMGSFSDLDAALGAVIEGHSQMVLPDDGWSVKEAVTDAQALEKGLIDILEAVKKNLTKRVHPNKILTDLVGGAKLKFQSSLGGQIAYKLFNSHQDYHNTMMKEGAGDVDVTPAFYARVVLAGILNVVKQRPYQGEATLVFVYQDVSEVGAYQHKHTLPVRIGGQ